MIRNAQQTDSAALSKLAMETYVAAFGHTFSPGDLAAHLQAHLSPEAFAHVLAADVVLVAEEEGQLVGYVQFGAAQIDLAQHGDGEIRRLYVHEAHQNKGYGTLLLEAALHHPLLQAAPRIYLDVWEHNHGAQRLYQRHGFTVVASRSFEVESGAPTSRDLVMVREG